MKKLLIAALIFAGCEIKAQKQTLVRYSEISDIGYVYQDSVTTISYYPNTNRISIHGDTIKAIIMLIGFIKEGYKREGDLWSVVIASASYFNSLPSYFQEKKNYKQVGQLLDAFKKVNYRQRK